MASLISSTEDPDPPWKTKSIWFSGRLNFFDTNSWEFLRIFGVNLTFPGLYTPWTFPKAAAIVNLLLILLNSSYA